MLCRDIKAIGRIALSLITGSNRHVFKKKDKTLAKTTQSYLMFIKEISSFNEATENKGDQILKL
jgi:DNA-nicking Smr family endonuclease